MTFLGSGTSSQLRWIGEGRPAGLWAHSPAGRDPQFGPHRISNRGSPRRERRRRSSTPSAEPGGRFHVWRGPSAGDSHPPRESPADGCPGQYARCALDNPPERMVIGDGAFLPWYLTGARHQAGRLSGEGTTKRAASPVLDRHPRRIPVTPARGVPEPGRCSGPCLLKDRSPDIQDIRPVRTTSGEVLRWPRRFRGYHRTRHSLRGCELNTSRRRCPECPMRPPRGLAGLAFVGQAAAEKWVTAENLLA